MSSSILEPGFRLGKYEVVSHVATGGMGSVYKALDLELRRTVALKVLPANLAQADALLERFRREARHAARLSHPNIVTLYENAYDEEKNLHYLALEYIDGVDLGRYIARRGKLLPEEARRILIQVAKALDHAFAQGIVHRDIKPSNLLLSRSEEKTVVKVTDLGLACGPNDEDFKITRAGSTVGTIDYISPEQACDSGSADIRSDIYSLGSTGYHMLAGKAPFAEGGLGERVYKIMNVPPPDVRTFNPAVSAGFWAILQKMLAKAPADRHATPAELLLDLKNTPSETSGEEEMPTLVETDSRRKTDYVPSPPARPTTPPTETIEPPSPVAPTRRRKRHAKPQPSPEAKPVAPLLVTLEQARAAAAFHQRVVEVLAEGGGDDYARQLLNNCLKLDPFNSAYRKTLRDMNRRASAGALGRWFGSLSVLAIKSQLRLARGSGDWRKVLEHGEEVLAHQPADAEAHLAMADAAEKLDLPHLALWFLEQGREQAPDNADLMRALARVCEGLKDLKAAIALWERVNELVPNDPEARHKMNDLSVQEHLAHGHYRK
jgi:serine/threonine protein kinase